MSYNDNKKTLLYFNSKLALFPIYIYFWLMNTNAADNSNFFFLRFLYFSERETVHACMHTPWVEAGEGEKPRQILH